MFRQFACLVALTFASVTVGWAADEPENFIFAGGDLSKKAQEILKTPEIRGVQIVYSWRRLEGAKGEYDFSEIERDLAIAEALDKKFFIQIQDRFFEQSRRGVPNYILNDPVYGGGLAPQTDFAGEGVPLQQGWVTMQWNPAVRDRFQHLLQALAEEFDGRVYGVNLPESAATIDLETDETGFTCDAYFEATLENVNVARAAFQSTHVIQYVNFWPCEWNDDRGYMSRIFKDAAEKGYGLGGPDIVPFRRGQMKNSYPFFNEYNDQLPMIAMAVQQPTLTYKNPETQKPFTRDDLVGFAKDYLGVDVIFWTIEAPWIKDGVQ